MSALSDTIPLFFPGATDCINGHIGPTVMTWYWEQDDDRAYLLKVPRCKHCGIPVGADDYATFDEQAAYNRGEQPNQSEEAL